MSHEQEIEELRAELESVKRRIIVARVLRGLTLDQFVDQEMERLARIERALGLRVRKF